MLFDLQSRGRRNVVKVIYLFLAILLGGGLLLFGVGTGTGAGGFFDIFRGGSSNNAQISSFEKRAAREVRLHPSDPKAWADLARARYQTAGTGEDYDAQTNAFTAKGRQKLASVAVAWKTYLRLDPQHPDVTLAHLMANTFSEVGLNQPAQAAEAMEIVTEQQPSAASYGAFAQYAYLAYQWRKGDLAAAKAVQLAPAAQQRLVRVQLANLKRQAQRQQALSAIRQTTSSTPRQPAPKSGTRGVG
jgi:hypothetical protein